MKIKERLSLIWLGLTDGLLSLAINVVAITVMILIVFLLISRFMQ